jgi:hypothetical protein
MNARLARLEQHVPAPQGPIVYRVYFHDGTPVWPRPGEETGESEPDVIYRIASWEDSTLGGAPRRIGR